MGNFLNEFLVNSQVLPALVVFLTGSLPTFGYFYNQLMDRLPSRSEHTSLYVAIGVAITLVAGALISWKAAVLYSVLFGLSGIFMIIGEFKRTERKRRITRINKNQRKRLPYAANGILDEGKAAATNAQTLLSKAINATRSEDIYKHLAAAALELSTVNSKLDEVKQIQLEK